MASFNTPAVRVNPVSWGPTELPEKFLFLPYNPFNKTDRLGRAADFVQKDSWGGRNRWRDDQAAPSSDPTDAFVQIEDPNKRRTGTRGGFRQRWQRGRNNRGANAAENRDPEAERAQALKGKQAKYLVQQGRRGKQFRDRSRNMLGRRWNAKRDQLTLEASVKVEPEWRLVDEITLASLTKLKTPIPEGTDLKWCGHVCRYNDAYERISTRNISKLNRFTKVVFNNTTSIDDPVLQEFAKERSGKGRVVLATDELLAHLMAAPRSIRTWDLVFTRFSTDVIFLDKRDDSGIEMLTVNETATVPQSESNDKTNTASNFHKLSVEATAINQNFSQQILDKTKKKEFENENPLFDPTEEEPGSESSSFAYRYREWDLGSDTKLIARTELHAYTRIPVPGGKKKTVYMTSFGLNEADPRLTGSKHSWRQKIDSSRGSVLADGIKNNSCKIGKWTAQSLLSGADRMKIGFISRRAAKDHCNHDIIGTQFIKPEDFAMQINLHYANCWGILKNLIDAVYKEPPGKYLILRDPTKPQLQLYQVPLDSFVDDDEDDDEDDDGEIEGAEEYAE